MTHPNFRRFPLPVSGSHAPVVIPARTLVVVLLSLAAVCLACGVALGVIGYAALNLRGILP